LKNANYGTVISQPMIAALMKDALDNAPIVGTKPIVEFS
jgi:hypothetical protein